MDSGKINEDIKFLKELQLELKTQENDCQAAPRFWVIGDYHYISCPEGFQEKYEVHLPNKDYDGDLDELLKEIKKDELNEFSDEAKEEFEEIACEVSAMEWIEKYYDVDASLIPVKEEHFIHENTMFLTKKEAKDHLKKNYYHYSSKAHTYAMTAWRAPTVERLFKILESFDWDKLRGNKE